MSYLIALNISYFLHCGWVGKTNQNRKWEPSDSPYNFRCAAGAKNKHFMLRNYRFLCRKITVMWLESQNVRRGRDNIALFFNLENTAMRIYGTRLIGIFDIWDIFWKFSKVSGPKKFSLLRIFDFFEDSENLERRLSNALLKKFWLLLVQFLRPMRECIIYRHWYQWFRSPS